MFTDDSGEGGRGRKTRRTLLKTLCALGVTGLAGCGGDGDSTETPTDTGTPTDTAATPTDTVPGTTTGTGTSPPTDTTESPAPTTESPTPTQSGCDIPGDPQALVSFGSDTLRVPPGTETVSGTIQNPYLGFTLESGNVSVSSQGAPDGWSIEAASGTSFDALEPQENRDASWNVTVPNLAEETSFELAATTTYSCGEETYEAETTQAVTIGPEGTPPAFVAADPEPSDTAPVSVVRQSGHFTPLQLLPNGPAQMVYFSENTDGFHSATFDWSSDYYDDSWHHVVASYDAGEGISGYIDGETIVEASGPGGALNDPVSPFSLATSISGGLAQELYEGALDEVAVYDTTLSASQAGALADGETVAEDSLVSMWTFEEVVFGRVSDQVGDNTIYLANGPEQVSGQAGQAIAFDGEESFAGSPSSDGLSGTEQKSVSFWFKTTQNP